eukprot:gnl/TRDRNA2_/TRDRNA2_62623_c1_seq1.p1 gnl/TRDRNA2_/TRDRNA2_62623_c1~~gnl/TRDRNA2_/TRDRNA2_62623_c1_seq1.p1  ORF type:complete len:348 (-),score=89.05 gnl/TRDRNA2_/TRDRNA2_62623_c1_seq1:34-1008(-)
MMEPVVPGSEEAVGANCRRLLKLAVKMIHEGDAAVAETARESLKNASDKEVNDPPSDGNLLQAAVAAAEELKECQDPGAAPETVGEVGVAEDLAIDVTGAELVQMPVDNGATVESTKLPATAEGAKLPVVVEGESLMEGESLTEGSAQPLAVPTGSGNASGARSAEDTEKTSLLLSRAQDALSKLRVEKANLGDMKLQIEKEKKAVEEGKQHMQKQRQEVEEGKSLIEKEREEVEAAKRQVRAEKEEVEQVLSQVTKQKLEAFEEMQRAKRERDAVSTMLDQKQEELARSARQNGEREHDGTAVRGRQGSEVEPPRTCMMCLER